MTHDPAATASALERVVVDLPSLFMIDMDTYAKGAELGFEGVDFYVAGRGGALGEVVADVVVASFVFFAPDTVRTSWERSAGVMGRTEAAQAFIEIGWAWAEAHLPDDASLPRLAELLGRVTAAAPTAGAPLFGAWRALPEPSAERLRAVVLHRLNLLRELRGALHGGAVLAAGVDPHQAVSDRAPYMLGIFGYPEPHHAAGTLSAEEWDALTAATDRAVAPAFAVLDQTEATELIDGLRALAAAKT